jgi:hypothetical protein
VFVLACCFSLSSVVCFHYRVYFVICTEGAVFPCSAGGLCAMYFGLLAFVFRSVCNL